MNLYDRAANLLVTLRDLCPVGGDARSEWLFQEGALETALRTLQEVAAQERDANDQILQDMQQDSKAYEAGYYAAVSIVLKRLEDHAARLRTDPHLPNLPVKGTSEERRSSTFAYQCRVALTKLPYPNPEGAGYKPAEAPPAYFDPETE